MEEKALQQFNLTPKFSKQEWETLASLKKERESYFRRVPHASHIVPAKEKGNLCFVMGLSSLSWWPVDVEKRKKLGDIPIHYYLDLTATTD